MVTDIYVISGFLGAGKTTLIQKLLKEAFKGEKVVLIENDFGEISVDAALLQKGSVEVKEINSGCICCSLSGDFVKALRELLEHYHPDKIIIEPSGVGKLSDIIEACSDPQILPLAQIKSSITVADVKRCKMYLENFGEFFEDQIHNADVVLLSRTEDYPAKVDDACRLIISLNNHAPILAEPWHRIAADEILYPHERVHHGHSHVSHERHEHGHDHAAEDVFDTVTIRTRRVFSIEDLQARVADMERNAKGTVLRAKGIVRSPGGYVNLQYLPGSTQVTACATAGDVLCIIGRNLDQWELDSIFGRE